MTRGFLRPDDVRHLVTDQLGSDLDLAEWKITEALAAI